MALMLVLWLTAGAVGIALVALWAMGAVHAGRAQTVADAVALAEGSEPGSSTRLVGGTDAVTIRRRGDRVQVTARVGEQAAHAEVLVRVAATLRRGGLAPSMVAAVARAEELLGVGLTITSGYRSPAQQQALWDRRETNPYPVARPGTSLHERGLAIDIALSQVTALRSVAHLAGLCHPLPQIDPVHFVACPIPE